MAGGALSTDPELRSLASLLDGAVAANVDGLAYRFGDDDVTYAEVDRIAGHIARNLLAAGLAPGDRVAMFMPNCLETAFVYLGCFRAGLLCVPVNHRDIDREVEYALRQSRTNAFVVHEQLFDRVCDLPYGDLGLERRWVVGDSDRARGGRRSPTCSSPSLPTRPRSLRSSRAPTR